MRTRTLLIVSLALNLLLVFGWFLSEQKNRKPAVAPPKISGAYDPFPHATKTNVIVRRLNFTWQEVESADYAAYIQNLREIGCPEQTIRDIIIADVNELYAHRREKEILPAEFQWWKSDLDADMQRQNLEKSNALDIERKTLLTKLLGPNWEAARQQDVAEHEGINLNGPLLGDLSPEAKQQIYAINLRSRDQVKQLQDAAEKEGRPVDAKALVELRKQSRADLAQILTPAQLEEFLLRYSETAKKIRDELRGVSLTPDEFRNLFRARDPLEDQMAVYGAGNDAASVRMQQTIDDQRDAMLRSTLGTDRYQAYRLNQDPLYRQALTTLQQAGVGTNLVTPLFQVNQATEAELVRIQTDATMTPDQKSDAVIAAEAEREQALEKILGTEAYQRMQLQQILNPGTVANSPVVIPP